MIIAPFHSYEMRDGMRGARLFFDINLNVTQKNPYSARVYKGF
jgi:hypothetical protein